MQVKTFVLAQKEIAKGHAAILACSSWWILRTAARPLSDLTERQHVAQRQCARPIDTPSCTHNLQIGSARTGTRQRQYLDVTRFQAQVQQ